MLALRSRRGHAWLTGVTYHRIGQAKDAGLLDPETFDASAAQFERQLEYLSQRHHFVSLDDIRRYLDGGELPPNAVYISFDDGYRECLETTLPILQRFGVRATFFIATSFTEDRRLPWWDRLSLLVRRRKHDQVVLDHPYPMELDLSRESEAIHQLQVLVKTHYGLDLQRFLDDLAEATGARLEPDEEREMVDRHLLTWNELRELKAAGQDLQCHTHTHRVLHTLRPEDLRQELRLSRRILTERVGGPIDAIAYPVGYPIGGANRIRRALEAEGFRVGFSNNTGANPKTARPDRFDVRRIATDASFTDTWFRAFMAWPALAYARMEPHEIQLPRAPGRMDTASEAE